ncbi:DUF2147 domain-containing protein [Faecalibacter rhinopitheci]|uniref:DUF2147 domain-containing protein n=1 Tax=Faecalibacter rhinopitheci TaxID=2779678 RepID=A0A8J7FY69_9FLAO|nr:DUF2147 domain-containing protein [Faecalibacter rhinopitheci]MBF0597843.1 DUF2147 domain-containing protein [Faecalibacter rhinopitheci]MBQ0148034.1 DUF2147 domain-containing protein [Candidatus Onthonaster equi]
MKKLFLFTFIMFIGTVVFGQSPLGTWKTIDDETGKEKSYVEIFEKDGKVYGKVVKILTKGKEDSKCTACKDARKDKPILNMVILTDLKKSGNEWTGGKILDPNSGKEYKATLKLNGKDKLDVRGYVGISLVGRTQTWQKVK